MRLETGAHLSHRTPGREEKHPEKQLIAILNIGSAAHVTVRLQETLYQS